MTDYRTTDGQPLMPIAQRSLHRKLAQVMYEAEKIPKRGKAPQAMGGYPFVQVGDAADFIRKALAEKVVTMMPSKLTVVGQVDRPTKSGGTMTTLDIVVEWTLTDGESGETFSIESFGAGADGGDKYSGKAMTNAMKYAFLAGFLLSTGDDVELGTLEAAAKPAKSAAPPVLDNGDGSLIGVVEVAKDSPDFLPHVGPEGPVLTFKLVSPAGGIKVVATGGLAEVLAGQKDDVVGVRVSCWGRVRDETFRPKGAKRDVTYQVLDLERIKTPTFTLPAPLDDDPPLEEPPDDVNLTVGL